MEAGTLERRVTVMLPVAYKTQRRVGPGPGHGVACDTDCTGGQLFTQDVQLPSLLSTPLPGGSVRSQ